MEPVTVRRAIPFYEGDPDGLAGRVLPSSIAEIADAVLRQRTIEAWRAAVALRRCIALWFEWIEDVKDEVRGNSYSPDSCLILHDDLFRLRDASGRCVEVLCRLEVQCDPFSTSSAETLMFNDFPLAYIGSPGSPPRETLIAGKPKIIPA